MHARLFLLLSLLYLLPVPVLSGQIAGLTQCSSTAEGVPSAVLGRAAQALGMQRSNLQPLRVTAWRTTLNEHQSDRSYAPFFAAYESIETWVDPRGGGLATKRRGSAFPGTEGRPSANWALSGTWASWFLRDTTVTPVGAGAEARALDPWAVLSDFQRTSDARLEGHCRYRDYRRLVVRRTGVFGPEYLLVDPRTFVPSGLVREEPHFLWGQVRVEYVWSNWSDVTGGGLYPLTLFRQVDGETNVSQTVTTLTRLPADSAPRLAIPDTALRGSTTQAVLASMSSPDTVRVDDATWLLVTRAYTIAVTLRRDTVFVLDATTGEARARADAEWIEKLFPGRHPVVLVVTDLAWPHIAGVRYWVASGATVVSHAASRAFIQRVLDRRFTREPDLLEQRRARTRLRFRAVEDSMVLAGGELVLHPIDGPSSEGALMAWLPSSRFLWPGDYIQNTRTASQYAREVLRATRRVGIVPERFAAQHVRLLPWRLIDSLHADEASTGSSDRPDAALLRTGRLERHASVTRNGSTTDRGPRVQELVRATYRGRPALIAVQVFETPAGPAIDSSIVDAATLAPIGHRGIHRSRTMVLDFEGSTVRGRYVPENEPARPIEQRLSARPYDSSLYDLVFAALPLREGYAARLPFYIYEQGGEPVWYTGTVTGSERLALRDGSSVDTWVVDVKEGDRTRSRLYVTREGEREVVRAINYIGGGTEYMTSR